MIDTLPDLTQNRGPAHYPERVTTDLTPEQIKALTDARTAQANYQRLKDQLEEAKRARNSTVRAAWPTVADLGPARVARELGNMTQSTLRGLVSALRDSED